MNVKIECTNELNTNWVGLLSSNPMQVIVLNFSLPLFDPICCTYKKNQIGRKHSTKYWSTSFLIRNTLLIWVSYLLFYLILKDFWLKYLKPNKIPITKKIPHSMVAFVTINHHMVIIQIQMNKNMINDVLSYKGFGFKVIS